MKTSIDLKKELTRINGKGYRSYKDVEGAWDFKNYILYIDHVQGDPFAAPSRVRISMPINKTGIPRELFNNNYKRIATSDFLIRLFEKGIRNNCSKVMGSGKSGIVNITRCDEEVLDRTAIIISDEKIEVRFEVGFPARGRSVLSRELEKILYEFLPNVIQESLIYKNINKAKLKKAVELMEDQEFLRKELKKRELVSFIANGSILPRESGISTRPLKDAIEFKSPKEFEVEVKLPNRGTIKGMGIKKGITLIIGGGYHGKSTLLNALELGVYNHIEGDGREFVISDNSAMKVRAEDGRAILKDDISLFINNLPNGKDTKKFTSENASGSTSQAANIVEALETGSNLLLIDEDTSATNFMIRDAIMQSLVSKEKEPITPFIEIVRGLYEKRDVSTIIVVGSSGDYFDIADTVIQMDSYEAKDVTEKAKSLSRGVILERIDKNLDVSIDFNRVVKKGFILKGPKGVKIKTLGIDGFMINKDTIDLKLVEQLVDKEQVTSIANIFRFVSDKLSENSKKSLSEVVDDVLLEIEKKGLLILSPSKGGTGNLALPRKQEIMASFNRYRGLKLK